MTFKQLIQLLPKVVRYNLKIIFAGKFFWFLLAAFGFFALFMFQNAWKREEINEGLIYSILMFPSMLLIFYPAVFGIQNDEDSRILEILFGIPDYKYKVWGVRLLMIYVAIFVILIIFSYIAILLLYPVNPLEMALQLMFPILFFGNMAFMLSTITRSGNGTAVFMIIIGIALMFLGKPDSFWNVLLNPFRVPDNVHPIIWEGILIKNRCLHTAKSHVCNRCSLLDGLLKLRGLDRNRFIADKSLLRIAQYLYLDSRPDPDLLQHNLTVFCLPHSRCGISPILVYLVSLHNGCKILQNPAGFLYHLVADFPVLKGILSQSNHMLHMINGTDACLFRNLINSHLQFK